MDMLCNLADEKKYKVFLYGAKKEVISKAKEKLTEKYKDYIVNNGEDLKILLGEWCDEHLVPDNFVKEIRKVV